MVHYTINYQIIDILKYHYNNYMKKYKNIETWVKAMRKDKQKKLWHDWFTIGGHDYTCEEYDESGKYMRYTSVTAWQHIDIETSNRYNKAIWLSDMVATAYPIEELRFSLDYYFGDKKDFKKWVIKELRNDNPNVPHRMIQAIQNEMTKGIFHAQSIIRLLATK